MKTPPKNLLCFLFCISLLGFGCVDDVFCGDGGINPGEECDDSNNTNNDGCSDQCLLEIGTDCGPPPNLVPNAKLQLCDLRAAALSGANLENANLSGANLISADLTGANLNGASLSDAGLLLANLTGASLIATFLGEANLTSINLTNAILTNANLTDANLSNANLSGADLSGVIGKPLNADAAIYNGTTCPSGINSDTVGFTCIDQGF